MRFDSKRWQGCSLQLTKYTHDIKNAREVIWLWPKNCTAMDTQIDWSSLGLNRPPSGLIIFSHTLQFQITSLYRLYRESGDYPSNSVLFLHKNSGHPWSSAALQVVRKWSAPGCQTSTWHGNYHFEDSWWVPQVSERIMNSPQGACQEGSCGIYTP